MTHLVCVACKGLNGCWLLCISREYPKGFEAHRVDESVRWAKCLAYLLIGKNQLSRQTPQDGTACYSRRRRVSYLESK